MIEIRPRETVILCTDFDAQVAWYRDVLGLEVKKLYDDGFHFCNLTSPSGIRLGLGLASELGVTPTDRSQNTMVVQIEVDDVKEFFEHLENNGGTVTSGPTYDKPLDFWFGSFADPEGNPFWVVDKNCP